MVFWGAVVVFDDGELEGAGVGEEGVDEELGDLVGVVGAGVAYLQMIRDGYVWCDHFENQLLLQTAPTKRSPGTFSANLSVSMTVFLWQKRGCQGLLERLGTGAAVRQVDSAKAPPFSTRLFSGRCRRCIVANDHR